MNTLVNESDPAGATRRALSSLMDGDLPPAAAADTCGAWRADAGSRAAWHAYHLIGDVLRSDELACPPARDEAFLQALRGRLAQEPVPLAPQALMPVPKRARLPGWLLAPVAVAAGFVAVAGLLVLTRVVVVNPADGGQMALAGPATRAPAASAGDVLRNAGLDRYLEAHRTLSNGLMAAGGAEHRVQIVFESK